MQEALAAFGTDRDLTATYSQAGGRGGLPPGLDLERSTRHLLTMQPDMAFTVTTRSTPPLIIVHQPHKSQRHNHCGPFCPSPRTASQFPVPLRDSHFRQQPGC